MKKILILLLIVTSVICMSMVSTGPSTIESEITPISINKKGQILCKTRFTQNKMGSYNPMIVEYGFCILTNDSILEIKTKVLNPNKFNNEDKYYEELKYWDKIFRGKTSTEQLYTIKNKILKNNYNFTEVNTDQYKVDKEISIVEFEKEKKISLKEKRQKALKNAKSTTYHSKKIVHILYDFGTIICLKNKTDYDDNEIGAYFDYLISWGDENGIEQKIDYDITTIVGVLNLK